MRPPLAGPEHDRWVVFQELSWHIDSGFRILKISFASFQFCKIKSEAGNYNARVVRAPQVSKFRGIRGSDQIKLGLLDVGNTMADQSDQSLSMMSQSCSLRVS